MGRIKGQDVKTYQGVDLIYFDGGLTYLQNHCSEYIESVLTCFRARIKPQGNPDIDLLNHVVKILATHGWEKTADASFAYESIELIATRFSTPLQEADVNIALLCEEWDDILLYAKQYINLVQNSYKGVWWKLYNCPDSPKWNNILSLVELLFTIPLSNGHLERCFSQLKITKSDRRICLKEDRLDSLLCIRIEGPCIEE